jgi:nicotinate phosphoribosyltransferase
LLSFEYSDFQSEVISPHSPLFTDLYELTMVDAYVNSKTHLAPATFELFFRRCPFQGEYAVVAGYERVQEVLENFRFSERDISYLKSLPIFSNTSNEFFETLQNLDLSDVEILGVPEGDLVFPRLPILQVRGPIYKVQLLESALLNAVNFATLVATYARRIRTIAKDKGLVEFGLRRAQGPNGAMTASRASFIGGFDATSNVLAGVSYGIPIAGTMAHSFVQSFSENQLSPDWNGENISGLLQKICHEDDLQTNAGEFAAFLAYAKAFPAQAVLLVDTYDSLLSGVPNAIRVFKVLRHFGFTPLGIRLDSGDLVYLSLEARKMLDEAGFHDAKIYASNELDEKIILSIQDQGAKIDSFGVGTCLVTAAADPALGGVYKLVELAGKPRMKISQQTEKLVLPAAKKVYRLFGKDGVMLLDLLAHESEPAPKAGQEILAAHPSDPFKKTWVTPSAVEDLLVPLFRAGKWLDTRTLSEKRSRSLERMEQLRPDVSRAANPTPYKVSLTANLKKLLDELYDRERPQRRLH